MLGPISVRPALTIEDLLTVNGGSYVKAIFSGNDRPYAYDGRHRIRSADENLPMDV